MSKNTKGKHRRKKGLLRSPFYRAYFAVVLLCVAAIALGMRYLDGLLADYESAQPVYVAEKVARLFEEGSFEAIYPLDRSVKNAEGINEQIYAEALREAESGKKLTWSETYSANEDEKLYRVELDGEKFAEFTLVPSGQTTEHGSRLWALRSVSTLTSVVQPTPESTPEPTQAPQASYITCTITVPSDCLVSVDGAALDANNVVTADIPTASAGLLPEGVSSPTLIRYAFLAETLDPQIEVKSASGEIQSVQRDGETDWSVPLPQNPELQAQYEEFVLKVAKHISSYSAKDASEASVLQYCAKNSPARESIKSFDNTWGTRHNGAVFENVQTSDYRLYSEDCFSCHVSFDYVATFGKSTVKTYPTVYTLYFIREKGEGKLYNFTLY